VWTVREVSHVGVDVSFFCGSVDFCGSWGIKCLVFFWLLWIGGALGGMGDVAESELGVGSM
jgi:hypothetical protein